jgi:hypothetical protein
MIWATRIKCGLCSRDRVQNAFSHNQLNKLRQWKATSGFKRAPILAIRCIDCTGGPAVELECSVCGKTKALDAFTKTQRKNLELPVSQRNDSHNGEYQLNGIYVRFVLTAAGTV